MKELIQTASMLDMLNVGSPALPFRPEYRILCDLSNPAQKIYTVGFVALKGDIVAHVFGNVGPSGRTYNQLLVSVLEYASAATKSIVDFRDGKELAPPPHTCMEDFFAEYAKSTFSRTDIQRNNSTKFDYRVGLTNEGRYEIFQCGLTEPIGVPTMLYSMKSVVSCGYHTPGNVLKDLYLYISALTKTAILLDHYDMSGKLI